jgi:hypothetical protein
LLEENYSIIEKNSLEKNNTLLDLQSLHPMDSSLVLAHWLHPMYNMD